MEQLQTEVVADMITYVDNQPIIVPQVLPTTSLPLQVQSTEEQIVTFDSTNSGLSMSSRTHSMVDLGKRLLHASRCGDVGQVRQLMANGAPFTTDWLGTSPLHFAAHSGHLSTAETLLRAGISRDARTKVDRTPLHCACQEGHARVAEVLLRHGADVDAKDMLRMAPIHWAVERNHRDVVELLLKRGADLTAEDKFDRTPIHIAVQNETLAIAHLLQNSQTSIETTLNTSGEDVFSDSNVVEAARNVAQQASTPLPIHHKRQKPAKARNMERSAGETSVLATLAALAEVTSTPGLDKSAKSEDTFKWLETHGITMVQADSGADDEAGGGVLTLTEAGKLALNLVKQQTGGMKRETTPNYAITTDENGQNVITIMTEQTIEPTTSTICGMATSRKDDEYTMRPSKRMKLDDDGGAETSLDSMDADELKRHLEEMQKQAREFRLQLHQKEQEAETYKRKLNELKGHQD